MRLGHCRDLPRGRPADADDSLGAGVGQRDDRLLKVAPVPDGDLVLGVGRQPAGNSRPLSAPARVRADTITASHSGKGSSAGDV